MRLVLQKVKNASVSVSHEEIASIESGYLLFLAILNGDTSAQAELLAKKIVNLRLFHGEDKKINDQSILDVKGEILVVSQFTLAAHLEKGNRPDYTAAAAPEEAEPLYRYFVEKLSALGIECVREGVFGAAMQVSLVNDGPVTLFFDR